MQNPFTLTFGRSPLESVDRPVQINEIIENFTADTINQQMFIITGVRGSGKTVMMTEISHKLRENDDWVVIELNPATDLLSAMLSKLFRYLLCYVHHLLLYISVNNTLMIFHLLYQSFPMDWCNNHILLNRSSYLDQILIYTIHM